MIWGHPLECGPTRRYTLKKASTHPQESINLIALQWGVEVHDPFPSCTMAPSLLSVLECWLMWSHADLFTQSQPHKLISAKAQRMLVHPSSPWPLTLTDFLWWQDFPANSLEIQAPPTSHFNHNYKPPPINSSIKFQKGWLKDWPDVVAQVCSVPGGWGLQNLNPAWTTHAETVLGTKTVSEQCPVYSVVSSATESRWK